VVLLLLLLLLARRRKAQQEAEKHLRMARALAEEQEFSADQDLPESSFEGLEVPPPASSSTPRHLRPGAGSGSGGDGRADCRAIGRAGRRALR
jgi:hypothetical protein